MAVRFKVVFAEVKALCYKPEGLEFEIRGSE
jgi:hypothetical protein